MSTRFAARAFRPRLLPILALLAVALLAGCSGANSSYQGGGVGVQVGGPPPELREEVYVDSPGFGYVWVPGFWDWGVNHTDWVWVPGSWRRPPHEHAVWVAPRYYQGRSHWMYERGHWN
jgi:hypothetical protein